ncbi:MAG: endonuclease/exonuclease/phosphatase family protein [Treponema sp.]|nr:endonuclease/exonuclease/phosphatase family protein [Treponema sp.]
MKNILIILTLIIPALAGCEAPGQAPGKEPELFTVALWNVQNLFDGVDDGTEYPDFRQSSGWMSEMYEARLLSLSRSILEKPFLPDLIGLIEVENSNVLSDLSRALSNRGYNHTAFAKLPGSANGVGFLSRYPLIETRAHSITIDGQTTPRPVLEVRVEARGEHLVFFLNHWKSKIGGENVTEALRRASASLVYRRLSEIKEADPDTPVIIMGDFNVNHDDFYRRSFFTALLPDDPDAALLASREAELKGSPDYLVISTEKPPRSEYFPADTHALYSPWGIEKEGGSYYFRGGWETIDGFLLSRGLFTGTGWDFFDALLLDREPFITSQGLPNSYIPRLGRGLSDHLPLLLLLKFM